MKDYQIATRFVTRIVVGSLLALFLGTKLDEFLHTTPFFLICFLLYVLIGTGYLLIKETQHGS